MNHNFQFLLTAFFLTLAGCSYQFPEVDDKTDNFEKADFIRFYVLGGTFSSGYMDGALYSDGQKYAFPALIGKKINDYYSEEVYRQFLVESDNGFNIFESSIDNPGGKYRLKYLKKDDILPARVPVNGEIPEGWDDDLNGVKDFSIPGLTASLLQKNNRLLDNPYFTRLPLDDTRALIDILAEQQIEILVLSLGFDDILLPAMNGLNTINSNDDKGWLSTDNFKSEINHIINSLSEVSMPHIFLLNIPNLVHSPYFSTLDIHFNLGVDVNPSQVAGFAQFYSEFNDNVFRYNFTENGGVAAELRRPIIDFDVVGGDQFRAKVIVDETLPDAILNDGTKIPKIRQLTEGEYLLYSADEKNRESADFGSVIPIEDGYVLTKAQIDFIENKIQEFNSVLEQTAQERLNIHIIDTFQKINEIRHEQYTAEGVVLNTRFERYSIYSADGYTLNPTGQAVVANLIIDSLNEKLGTSIHRIDVSEFPALNIENSFN